MHTHIHMYEHTFVIKVAFILDKKFGKQRKLKKKIQIAHN